MTHNHEGLPRHHWLIRFYRAQLRFELRVLTAVWIIPPPIAAAVLAWLHRTEIPKRGSSVKSSIRSKIVVPIVILLGLTALVLTLIARRHESPTRSSQATSPEATVLPGEVQQTPVRLDAWQRPTTTDAREFAIAYARAIWTYDTTRHGLEDWQDAISVYADPSGAAPQVAMSLLPPMTEWRQLQLRKAHATVAHVSAVTTPQLKAMANSAEAPDGWRGFVVRGNQTVVLDSETTLVERQATVAVVCTRICKFWSATAEIQP